MGRKALLFRLVYVIYILFTHISFFTMFKDMFTNLFQRILNRMLIVN